MINPTNSTIYKTTTADVHFTVLMVWVLFKGTQPPIIEEQPHAKHIAVGTNIPVNLSISAYWSLFASLKALCKSITITGGCGVCLCVSVSPCVSVQGPGCSGHVWDEHTLPAAHPVRSPDTPRGAAGWYTQLQCHCVGHTHCLGFSLIYRVTDYDLLCHLVSCCFLPELILYNEIFLYI